MADLRPQRRIEDGDREALEHIARALEGRVLFGPGAKTPLPERVDIADGKNSDGSNPLALQPEPLRLLLEAMPAAIGLLQAGTLIYLNSAFAYAFGYRSPAELTEAGGLDAILPGGAAMLQCEDGTGRTGDVDALTRSRRRLKVTFALNPLDAASDTTLLRLIDQAGLETEPPAPAPKAEAPTPQTEAPMPAPAVQAAPAAQANTDFNADAATRRLDFLAKVSHEVRTPLNSILGFTEMMMGEKLGAIENVRYKGYIEDIHQSGLYALSLLNDLLDLSKIEAGEFELDFTAVDIGEIVEECIHILQPMSKRERILVRQSLEPDLPSVIADPRRLKQILLNLLSNAIKFTREGGQVILSGCRRRDGAVRLRIRDNGVGMTADELQLAMQPFHQLDTTPRKQTGTGLGLPLTKALVEANRARFLLTSETGVGTSADVIFPSTRVADAPR